MVGGLQGMPWSSMPWLQCHWSGFDGPEEGHPHHMGVQGQKQDFIPQAHIHPFIHRCQWERFHLSWNFHPLQGHCICKYPSWFQLWPRRNVITLLGPLAPPPRILHPLMLPSHVQGILPTLNYSAMGTSMGYYFNPMMRQHLQPSVSNTYSLPVIWDIIL